jgi:hypothetical protein
MDAPDRQREGDSQTHGHTSVQCISHIWSWKMRGQELVGGPTPCPDNHQGTQRATMHVQTWGSCGAALAAPKHLA